MANSFQFGDWTVHPRRCLVESEAGERSVKLEPRVMNVLVVLCSRPGEIFNLEDLLRQCWDGVTVGENQVHKAISQLRRVLDGEDGTARHIENVRKRGYRTIAPVSLPSGDTRPAPIAWTEGSPYLGLDPFDEAHASLFFGREAAVSALLELTRERLRDNHALVLILGPSGSGKTSLVRAGLVPALRRTWRTAHPLSIVTLDLADVGDIPLLSVLGSALLDMEIAGEPVFNGRSADEIGRELADGPQMPAIAPGDERFLLFVDRLEALFGDVADSAGQRQRFLVALERLATSGRFIVVAACRNDFYPNVVNEPVLMSAKAHGGHFDLTPANRAEITAMIQRPAALAGLGFETDTDTNMPLDLILCEAAAGNPDALPLLQYTLQELYDQRSTRRELTITAYRSLGGVEGAIGRRAEMVLSGLPEPMRNALTRLLPLMITLNPHDGSVRGRQVSWAKLTDEAERRLVTRLVEHRLFVSLSKDGDVVFGVAHEALLRQWPRVVQWISSHRQALHAKARLEGAAQRWSGEARRTDLLLPRGLLLEEALSLTRHPAIDLNEECNTLIAASVGRARRGDRLRLASMAAFALIALAAAFFAITANHAENLAARRQHQAEDLMNFMVGDFADKLRPLGRLDLLSDVGAKALDYFTEIHPDQLSVAERHGQARALTAIAEVARGHADPKSALSALNLASQLLNRNLLADAGDEAALRKDLGANAFWRGQIALDQGRPDDAWKAFDEYRTHAERMVAIDPDNVDAWIELSYALNSLGSAAQRRSDLAGAAEAFERSITLKRQALARRPDDRDILAGLANSHSWLGSVRRREGALRAALALFEEEQAILNALRAAAPHSESSWSHRLVIAMRRRAELLADLGDVDAAEREYVAAHTLALDLTRQDPANRLWKRVLLGIDTNLGELLSYQGRLTEALQLQQATAASMQELTRQDPANKEWGTLAFINQVYLARTLLHLNRADGARQLLASALASFDQIDRQGDAELIRHLAQGHILLAKIKETAGEGGINECHKALSLLEPLFLIERKNINYQIAWVDANICIGNVEETTTSIGFLDSSGYRKGSDFRPVPVQKENDQ